MMMKMMMMMVYKYWRIFEQCRVCMASTAFIIQCTSHNDAHSSRSWISYGFDATTMVTSYDWVTPQRKEHKGRISVYSYSGYPDFLHLQNPPRTLATCKKKGGLGVFAAFHTKWEWAFLGFSHLRSPLPRVPAKHGYGDRLRLKILGMVVFRRIMFIPMILRVRKVVPPTVTRGGPPKTPVHNLA